MSLSLLLLLLLQDESKVMGPLEEHETIYPSMIDTHTLSLLLLPNHHHHHHHHPLSL